MDGSVVKWHFFIVTFLGYEINLSFFFVIATEKAALLSLVVVLRLLRLGLGYTLHVPKASPFFFLPLSLSFSPL